MKATIIRKMTMVRRKTCGLDNLCGSYISTSERLPMPKDLRKAIRAPFPMPPPPTNSRLTATLNAIVTKLNGAWQYCQADHCVRVG